MKLLDARLDLDLRCNYRCQYCPTHKKDHGKQSWFPLDNLQTVFSALQKCCWSVFLSCAGEPLLHPMFSDACALSKKHLHGVDVSIVTNGWNMTEEHAQSIVDAGISRVYVSIDSVNPVLYKKLVGKESARIAKVQQNIARLKAIRGDAKWPKIGVISVLMQDTVNELASVMDWVIDAGLDCYRLHFFVPPTGAEHKVVNKRSPEIRAILRHISKKAASHKIVFDYPYKVTLKKISSTLNGASLVKNKVQYVVSFAQRLMRLHSKEKCRMIGNALSVTNDGVVYLCPTTNFPVVNLVEHPDADIKQMIAEKMHAERSARAAVCRQCANYS